MFTSNRVPCYLNQFSGHGDDTENKELKLVFFVTPITQELASEISPFLADRLFRLDDDREWQPAAEITKANHSSLVIPMQNVEFHDLPDIDSNRATLVEGVGISNLRSARTPDDTGQFRLEFDAIVPMNRETMRLIEKHYKATVYLTMHEIQRKIEFESGDVVVTESLGGGGRRRRKAVA